jgi:signal transduction histidine kinase
MSRPAPPAPTIARQLTRMNMLVSGTALLLACGIFVVSDVLTFRAAIARNLSTQAQMIASNSVSALVFNDPGSAQETLAALRAAPNIESAHVFAADRRLFASYQREPQPAPTLPRMPDGGQEYLSFDLQSVSLARPILFENKPIGVVYIRSGLQAMHNRLFNYGVFVTVVLLISLVTALLTSRLIRRRMAAPIVAMAGVARRVAEQNDYSLRAAAGPGTSVELSILVEAFNEMLGRIQLRDAALEEARDALDERVRARTAELKAKNEELEAFSYSVSHDLRSPLRHVTGFASLLAQHAGDALDDRGRHYVTTIVDAANRMGRLIDDLLSFSRMGRASLSPRKVDLAHLVRDARTEVEGEGNGRRITWSVGRLPAVMADPALLRPALVNLLSNAVKYTATRSEARIEIGAEPTAEGEAVVYVRDNGVGFDAAYSHKLFGVFQRLHRSDEFSGTGIGLANVRRIIQRHGGRTWAEGELDRGATFYFSLPLADGDDT